MIRTHSYVIFFVGLLVCYLRTLWLMSIFIVKLNDETKGLLLTRFLGKWVNLDGTWPGNSLDLKVCLRAFELHDESELSDIRCVRNIHKTIHECLFRPEKTNKQNNTKNPYHLLESISSPVEGLCLFEIKLIIQNLFTQKAYRVNFCFSKCALVYVYIYIYKCIRAHTPTEVKKVMRRIEILLPYYLFFD